MKFYIDFVGVSEGRLRKLLLIMKLTVVLLITAFLQVSIGANAQKVTLSKKGATLEEVFKQIRLQTGYNFMWNPNVLKGAKPVSISLVEVNIEEAVAKCLENQALDFVIKNKTIVIKEKEPSFLDKLTNVIQSVTKDLNVKGRVVDQDGKPLPNASIRVKGKSAVTNTNQNGEFEIKNVADDAVLLISYVGFRTLELPLKDAVMPLEIKLNVATGELEEVKVVYNTGYQELNKERATGSFVHVDEELLNRSVSTNILDRLRGVVSGLNFGSARGSAGNDFITIRGNSTIEANFRPLIVVDGFPYDESQENLMIINNINPNDVESVTVLKDAAAASIWGARAGNGVIVITTKKGKFNQPTNVEFNSNVNIGKRPDLFYIPSISSADMISYERKQFATGYWNAYDDSYPSLKFFPSVSQSVELMLAARKQNIGNPNYNPLADQILNAKLDMLSNNDIRRDINRYLMQNSVNQQYHLNISGGSQKANYYGTVGYDRNKSNNVGDLSSRLTIRFDNTVKLTNKLEVKTFITYNQNRENNNSFPLSSFNNISPYSSLSDENGNPLAVSPKHRTTYLDTASYPALLDWYRRPLDELKNTDNVRRQYDVRIGGTLNYQVVEGLQAEVKYQYQNGLNKYENYYNTQTFTVRDLVNIYMSGNPVNVIYPVPYGAILDRSNSTTTQWNVRGQLNFNKSWKSHRLALLVGMERSEVNSSGESARYFNYDKETGTYNNAINYGTSYPVRPTGTRSIPTLNGPIPERTNRYLSYYTNGSYTFQDKYTLSASARVDGANFFGIKANQRFEPLWSAGAAWDLSKELFYKINWLPYLKLRATYGANGNMYNTTTAYPTMQVNNPGPFSLHQGQWGSLVSPGNPELRWERIYMTNFAVDFETKNQTISGSIEGYFKRGIDLIGPIISEPTSGVVTYSGNNASIKGRGLELRVSTKNLRGAFSWNTGLLANYNVDKVISYNVSNNQSVTDYLGGVPVVGKPLFSLYSYHWAGLDPLNGEPRIYIGNEIENYSKKVNAKPEDLIYNGTLDPRYTGSLLNTIQYRNLSFSFNIMGSFKYVFRRRSINYASLINQNGGHEDFSKRWLQPGDEYKTNVPSLDLTGNSDRDDVYRQANILIEKGDHIRLQDINLSYELNKADHQSLPFRYIKLFIYSRNIGILWKANKLGIDPVALDSSIPKPISFAIGLNVNL